MPSVTPKELKLILKRQGNMFPEPKRKRIRLPETEREYIPPYGLTIMIRNGEFLEPPINKALPIRRRN